MNRKFKTSQLKSLLIVMGVLGAGCEKNSRSFSILSETKSFKQSSNYVAKSIDILWVIDNSNSMLSSQQNLAENFNSFITRFQTLNYDFQMGVTTTEAYQSRFKNDPQISKLKDGADPNHSGVFILNRDTPDLTNVFITNITQGINGSGDERAFSSFLEALNNPLNSSLRREGSFLAIIIVSDEDDFSSETQKYLFQNYDSPNIIPTSYYVDYLNTLTQGAAGTDYSVNTISILDENCLNILKNEFAGRVVGKRYNEIADLTKGIKGDICSDFGTTLNLISNSILELSTNFKLDRKPVSGTIIITIDGIKVPENSENGWTYDEASNSISFHGTYIPKADADVLIDYDPQTIKQ